jgi:hypothetical protein
MLRSIRPKRAAHWLRTSGHPWLLERRQDRRGDQAIPSCLERVGARLTSETLTAVKTTKWQLARRGPESFF